VAAAALVAALVAASTAQASKFIQKGIYDDAQVLYGNPDKVFPTLRQALDEKPLTVFGTGSQTRSFCFVDDLVRGLISLAESGEHLPVNVGNPAEMTLLELAEAVVRATGSSSPIVFEALPVDDPQVRQPDITRAQQILGWAPEIELDEGLRRTLASLGRNAPVA